MWDVQWAKTVLPISWKSSRRKQVCPGSTPTIASEWQQLVCCAGTALMTVTFGVYLGTRPLTVSGHTALGRLTSSGTGWAACCMIMATVAIVTWRLPFRSVVHSQIAPCHRLQGFTSHVLLACRKRMSPAVPWHPLLTGSLGMRLWALLTMTRSFWLSVVVVVVVGDPVTWRWLWAAKVNKKCWRASLLGLYVRAVAPPCLTSMAIFIFFEWTFCVMCQCDCFFFLIFKDFWHFSTLPEMNDNSDNLLGHYNFSRF